MPQRPRCLCSPRVSCLLPIRGVLTRGRTPRHSPSRCLVLRVEMRGSLQVPHSSGVSRAGVPGTCLCLCFLVTRPCCHASCTQGCQAELLEG